MLNVRRSFIFFSPQSSVGDEDGKAGPAVTADIPLPDPSAEYDAIPPTEQVCTVLGRRYCAIRDRDDLLKDLESRLWFTYRRFLRDDGIDWNNVDVWALFATSDSGGGGNMTTYIF